jgi:hypothetical protein
LGIKNLIKHILRPFVPNKFRLLWRKLLGRKLIQDWLKSGLKVTAELKEWQQNGCPIPPPDIIKQITIQEYQQKYGYTTLVETGTYIGEMVEAQKARFKRIISVELDLDLYEKAQKRFVNDKNIIIVHGDSGKMLPKILNDINEPAIFWLDGHYSSGITARGEKECPIFEELDAILSTRKFNHIILIDDARCFTGRGDYPTIKKLTEYINRKDKKYKGEEKHDIIRYVI